MAQNCPQCGLTNPSDARRCDCGYDLAGRPPVVGPPTGLRHLLLSFNGRIGGSTYWLRFFLPYVGIYLGLVALDAILGTLDENEGVGVLSGIFLLVALYPSLAVAAKRCHDRDRSAWFLLVGVVPILNLWPMIELRFLSGTPGPNRYGLPEMPITSGA